MPDPNKLLTTLERATSAFQATPGRSGRLVELQEADEILVTGDLHGNLENFSKIIKIANLGHHPARHLVLQEIIHGPTRYPNGADRSHQLLDLLAALKCQFPSQVHFVMGNHELSQWTQREIGKGDESCNQMFANGVATAYGDYSSEIITYYDKLFAAMPLAIRTPNRVFISHSIPPANRMGRFELSCLQQEQLQPEDYSLGGAVHSLVWGRDADQENVQRFLEKVDADWLITGHVPCEEGSGTPNEHQLILDSSRRPACYCLFSARDQLSLKVLVDCVGTL